MAITDARGRCLPRSSLDITEVSTAVSTDNSMRTVDQLVSVSINFDKPTASEPTNSSSDHKAGKQQQERRADDLEDPNPRLRASRRVTLRDFNITRCPPHA